MKRIFNLIDPLDEIVPTAQQEEKIPTVLFPCYRPVSCIMRNITVLFVLLIPRLSLLLQLFPKLLMRYFSDCKLWLMLTLLSFLPRIAQAQEAGSLHHVATTAIDISKEGWNKVLLMSTGATVLIHFGRQSFWIGKSPPLLAPPQSEKYLISNFGKS